MRRFLGTVNASSGKCFESISSYIVQVGPTAFNFTLSHSWESITLFHAYGLNIFIAAVYMRTVTKMYRYQLYECVPCPYSHAVSFAAAAAIGGRRVNDRDNTCSSSAPV